MQHISVTHFQCYTGALWSLLTKRNKTDYLVLALYLIFKITLGIVGWSCYQTLSTIHNYHYPSSLALPYYRRNSQNLPKQQKATPCFSPISKIALKFAQILSLPSPTTLKSSVWEFEGNGTEQRNCTNILYWDNCRCLVCTTSHETLRSG